MPTLDWSALWWLLMNVCFDGACELGCGGNLAPRSRSCFDFLFGLIVDGVRFLKRCLNNEMCFLTRGRPIRKCMLALPRRVKFPPLLVVLG